MVCISGIRGKENQKRMPGCLYGEDPRKQLEWWIGNTLGKESDPDCLVLEVIEVVIAPILEIICCPSKGEYWAPKLVP